MSVVNRSTNAGSGVKFIEYTGAYPNLCSGVLTIEVNGKRYRFGYEYKGKNLLKPFWKSGGSCGFIDDYSSVFIEHGEWIIDEGKLPNELVPYVDEIDKVFNSNVPFGCCGGCT